MKWGISAAGYRLNKSAFYGEPAQLCDAGINKIKASAPLVLPQKFPNFFNLRFPRVALIT